MTTSYKQIYVIPFTAIKQQENMNNTFYTKHAVIFRLPNE